MEDRAAWRDFREILDIRCTRCGRERDERRASQHHLQLFGNLHFEYAKRLLTLAPKLLRPSDIQIINDEMFDLGKYRQQESGDFEIDQPAPDQPHTIHLFVAV